MGLRFRAGDSHHMARHAILLTHLGKRDEQSFLQNEMKQQRQQKSYLAIASGIQRLPALKEGLLFLLLLQIIMF